jgi:rhodanese-related sulfurtransferase
MSESTQFLPDSTDQHNQHALSQSTPSTDEQVLANARLLAQQQDLPFAGSISPPDAWQLVQDGQATLVDVRTAEERKFVGYVPDSIHVAWVTGISLNRNPRFVKEFENKVKGLGKDMNSVVVLLCRSGKRSAAAAEALTNSGFTHIFNIDSGFEGEINADNQRGFLGGWRSHSLPWIQD